MVRRLSSLTRLVWGCFGVAAPPSSCFLWTSAGVSWGSNFCFAVAVLVAGAGAAKDKYLIVELEHWLLMEASRSGQIFTTKLKSRRACSRTSLEASSIFLGRTFAMASLCPSIPSISSRGVQATPSFSSARHLQRVTGWLSWQ